MPAGRENAPPKALSGVELQEILKQDFERLLRNNSMLSGHLAYGRVAYTLSLNLHLDKIGRIPTGMAESSIAFASRGIAVNLVDKNPNLEAIETAPLASPSPDAEVFGANLTRSITSPNTERIRAGIPIEVTRKDLAGNLLTEKIKYPKDESLGVGDVMVKDTSIAVATEWQVPAPNFEVDNFPLESNVSQEGHPTKS